MAQHTPIDIGAKLKAARLARGLGRRALAERSGVNVRLIAAIEQATASPAFVNVAALAAVLGVDLNTLRIEENAPGPYTGPIRPQARFDHDVDGVVVVEAVKASDWPHALPVIEYGYQPADEDRDLGRLRWQPADAFRANARPLRGPRVETVSDTDPGRDSHGRPLRVYAADGTDLGEAGPTPPTNRTPAE